MDEKNLKKTLDEQQKGLNELRNQIINLERELYLSILLENAENAEQILPKDVYVHTVLSEEVLKEARQITIREFALEVNLSTRAKNALCRSSITNLEDIYIANSKGDAVYGKIRNLGDRSIAEIRQASVDIPGLISRIKERRENIDKYNQPLAFLLDVDTVTKLAKFEVITLKDLYKEYTEKRSAWSKRYLDNSVLIELLLRY